MVLTSPTCSSSAKKSERKIVKHKIGDVSKTLFKKYENGFYEGSLLHEKYELTIRHGHGTFFFDTGERYTGAWNLDKMEGQGVYVWPNGCTYTGDFKAGRMGKGTFTWTDGEAAFEAVEKMKSNPK